MADIRLLTRADDAGLCSTANRAVRATVLQGIARNISLMAPAPSIEDAASCLAGLDGTADFGLHVCLTAEWPRLRWGAVSRREDIASLIRDDGSLHFNTEELASAGPSLDEIMTEVKAQFSRLIELGFNIKYIDEHMGLSSKLDGFSERLEEFAHENKLINSSSLFRSGALEKLPGWPGPGEHPGTELADHLAETKPGTYLLVGHPMFKSEEAYSILKARGADGNEVLKRNRQRRMFADIEIVDYCENVGIKLIRYSDATG